MKKLPLRAVRSCVEAATLWGEKTLYTYAMRRDLVEEIAG